MTLPSPVLEALAFWLTVAVSSSIDAAVSSRLEACDSVRADKSVLPAAICVAATLTDWDWVRTRAAMALNRLAQGGVDIALLDLGLPDGDGMEIVRKVRAIAPQVPLVVPTGRDDDKVIAEAMIEKGQWRLPWLEPTA